MLLQIIIQPQPTVPQVMGQVVQTQDGQTIIYQPVQQNAQATTTEQSTPAAATATAQPQQHIQLQTQS